MNNYQWLLQMDGADRKAWFDAEHVETEERALDGDTVALEAEYGKGGLVGGSFIDIPEQGEVVMPLESWRDHLDTESESEDSRERLEADVFKAADDMEMFYNGERFIDTRKIIGWLDRQAAITERECIGDAGKASMMGVVANERECYGKRIAELTAERDNWKANCEDWKKDCERYRSKFGKCLDYADAIHALMDDEGMA